MKVLARDYLLGLKPSHSLGHHLPSGVSSQLLFLKPVLTSKQDAEKGWWAQYKKWHQQRSQANVNRNPDFTAF